MKQLAYLITVFVFVGITPSCLFGQESKNPVGQPNIAPNFTVYDLSGRPVQLSDFKGKHVLLNFWATWCPPCRTELPSLQKLSEQYRELIVLTITFEKPVEVKKFLAVFEAKNRIKITFVVGVDTSRTTDSLYNIQYLPTTYYIFPDGTRLENPSIGGIDWQEDDVQAFIRKFLAIK